MKLSSLTCDGPAGSQAAGQACRGVAPGRARCCLGLAALLTSRSAARCWLVVAAVLTLCGCMPGGENPADEQKEPHFLAGKGRVNAMDYTGAIESFEKALEVNPRSASAHFELGWLCDQKNAEPAEAIYHYDQYLKLLPHAPNAETVKTRIMACKQELARTVSLGPVTQTLEREFDKLDEKNKRLEEEVARWQGMYNALLKQSQTNSQAPPPLAVRVTPPTSSGETVAGTSSNLEANSRTRSTPTLAAAARTHTIRAGETPSLIARQYGVKVDSLMAANPRMDARRLRPGQTLNIPLR